VPFTNVTTFKYITKVERDNSKLNYPSDKKYLCAVTKLALIKNKTAKKTNEGERYLKIMS